MELERFGPPKPSNSEETVRIVEEMFKRPVHTVPAGQASSSVHIPPKH